MAIIIRPEITFGRRVTFARPDGLLSIVMDWDARFRARRALAALPPERCADLGLTQARIAAETAKPFWRH
jgi:uncharacterized protein YjiS (DUF1127 family)